MDIETALRWAYRDELPKARAWNDGRFLEVRSGWSTIESYVDLLTKIDPNRYGVIPDVSALSWPDPDAVAIGEAVRELDALALEVPAEWNPIADLGGLAGLGAAAVAKALAAETTIDSDGARRFKFKPSWLILRHALRMDAPDWEIETPKVEPLRTANGQPIWFRMVREFEVDGRGHAIPGAFREIERTDGLHPKSRRPRPDAYRKYQLDPDPHFGIVERMRYEVWRSALDLLCDDLAGRLDSVALTPSPRPARPWETGYVAGAVWRDLTGAAAPRAIGKPSVIAAAPLRRRLVRRRAA